MDDDRDVLEPGGRAVVRLHGRGGAGPGHRRAGGPAPGPARRRGRRSTVEAERGSHGAHRHPADQEGRDRSSTSTSSGARSPSAGELVAKHVFYHDITELQEQKRYFESLLEISPTAIVITDLDSKIVSWNPAAEKLFGYSAEEAVGRKTDDLVADAAGASRARRSSTPRPRRAVSTSRPSRSGRGRTARWWTSTSSSRPVMAGEEQVGLLHHLPRHQRAPGAEAVLPVAARDQPGRHRGHRPRVEGRLLEPRRREALRVPGRRGDRQPPRRSRGHPAGSPRGGPRLQRGGGARRAAPGHRPGGPGRTAPSSTSRCSPRRSS